MQCPACNYAMDSFDKECPRCQGKGNKTPTVSAPTTRIDTFVSIEKKPVPYVFLTVLFVLAMVFAFGLKASIESAQWRANQAAEHNRYWTRDGKEWSE